MPISESSSITHNPGLQCFNRSLHTLGRHLRCSADTKQSKISFFCFSVYVHKNLILGKNYIVLSLTGPVLEITPFGAISSDLYRPKYWDENFKFSFSVVLSKKSNLQLGCFWWKSSTSSLKTFYTPFVLNFVNLMSRHDICDFSRFTW